jgi:hypothetical protein
MQPEQLKIELLRVLRGTFPAIEVQVGRWEPDPGRLALRFVEPSFAELYQQQRYHKLVHLIPRELFEREPSSAVWFELAPGEQPEDLRSADEELVEELAPAVLGVLAQQGAFQALDDLLCPADLGQPAEKCAGDFRNMRRIVEAHGHDAEAQFDIFHVLMARGGFCDCEILTNVAEGTRMRARAWRDHRG